MLGSNHLVLLKVRQLNDAMVVIHVDAEAGSWTSIALHPRTALPFWTGERLDVGYAIDVLHPLARVRVMTPVSPYLDGAPPSKHHDVHENHLDARR